MGGDYFHKWNAPPEIINFALEHLPYSFGIYGNHDLPYHNVELKKKSAYWTLVEAGPVEELCPAFGKRFDNGLVVYGYPFGAHVRPIPAKFKNPGEVHMALVHEYVWWGTAKYPDAPQSQYVSKFQDRLNGYDCAAFGDNHKFFSVQLPNGCNVMNCGGFYRSKSDERDMHPCVGLVCDDGKIYPHYLDVSQDKWIDSIDEMKEVENQKEEDVRAAEFLLQLAKLGDEVANFKEVVENMIKNAEISEGTRQIVLDAIERKSK